VIAALKHALKTRLNRRHPETCEKIPTFGVLTTVTLVLTGQ
jgi:hypothetical protein